MAYVMPIIALYVVSLILASLAAPSPDPYTVFIYQAVILAIVISAYVIGYRRGKRALPALPEKN